MARHRERRAPLSAVSEFLSIETLGGVVLLGATLAALVWANVSFVSYEDFWTRHFEFGIGSLAIDESARHWINDGLMAVFFFVVGLEVKREFVRGELRDPRTASLPIIAAAGGMVVPFLLFTALNYGTAADKGWAIPMTTDIAFAVAVLALLGSRVPSGAKLFLLTLAIADDIGAILVIAVFYSDHVSFAWLAAATTVVVVILAMQRARIGHPLAYVVPALALWVCVIESGVHATIAGVALGLLTPARPFGGKQVIEGLEHRLHPWSSILVVPLFALANAGIPLGVADLERAASSAISWGVILGLVIGKPLGIALATMLALKARAGRLPRGVRTVHVLGVGQLAGIGFTVALFVASLSYAGVPLTEAKIGILAASALSALLGISIVLGAHRTRTHAGSLDAHAER
jgi:NhaA family Na+:H+ antiporter